jgi:hypothetical protein
MRKERRRKRCPSAFQGRAERFAAGKELRNSVPRKRHSDWKRQRNRRDPIGGYHKGMATFTVAKGGLMYEAAIGGQKFKYTPR